MRNETNTLNRAGWVAWSAAACVLAGSAIAAAPPKFSHPREITNPYLPLSSLKQDILEGKEAGKALRVERTLRPELHKTFKIGKQGVDTLVMEDREFENGELSEVTLDYFAQADDGTVYYLGEDVDEYKKGRVVGHEGAWLLGVQTKVPGVMMPGRPQVGDKFRSEDVAPITTEDNEVLSLNETVSVPAGTYRDCLKVKETLSDGAVEYKYYAKGVGCVREVPQGGDVLLKSHAVRVASLVASAGVKPALGGNAPAPAQAGPKDQDPLARVALSLVGADPLAEAYWMGAINDPSLSGDERQNLIEDLNEDGLSDATHPAPEDLALILNRLALLEDLAPGAMDRVNADAFQEAYKDLVNLAQLALGGGHPVN